MINKYFSPGLSPLNNDNLIENSSHYDIKILNNTGDSSLTLTHSITPINEPMISRKHEIFCDASSMESNEMNLTAWDGKKNELLVEINKDYPSRKYFKIHFKDCLKQNSIFKYSFSFNWKQMFPSKEEYFKLKKINGKSSFCLHYPKSWSMLFLKAEYESETDNSKPVILTKKKPKIKGEFKIEECNLDEVDVNSSVIISWNRK
jgi:hypothetical protein